MSGNNLLNNNLNVSRWSDPSDTGNSNIKSTVGSVQTTGQKKKVLVWSDAVMATTGFGVVSKNILGALHMTGRYEIDQLAINHFGDFADTDEVPFQVMPARLGNPRDPYGNQMFLDALGKKEYDIVFVINDTFVLEGVSAHINEIRDARATAGQKPFELVYYFPVDCRFMPKASGMAKAADRNIAYTNFAKQSALQVPGVKVHDVIYHGTDTKIFRPMEPVDVAAARKRFLNISDPDKFLWINVNRNNSRKDIAHSILAFKKFREKVPNSALYLHTKMLDSPGHGQEIDLGVPIEELAFDIKQDVIFPNNLHPAKGFPVEIVNLLYNAADGYLTTTLGEGWGLTITEAMAAGCPVVAPCNTSIPEILGEDGDRGYVYECKDHIYIDNSGYRPYASTDDIVDKMMECYEDWKEKRSRRRGIIERAQAFTKKYSWDRVCRQWVQLFGELGHKRYVAKTTEGEVL